MGAGAVGCYLGGRLLTTGSDVIFVGRPRLRDEIATAGLTLRDLDGTTVRVPPEQIAFSPDPATLAGCDRILICVKSAHTAEAAAALAPVIAEDAVVISMQNGVRNAAVLRAGLPGRVVLGGIVSFNVVPRGPGIFARATSGPLVIEASPDPRVLALARTLTAAGFQVQAATDIQRVQYSKLIMNLNNAVSALSGAPTRDLIFTPGFRRVLGLVIREALEVMRRAGIRPARLGAVPVHLFPHALRLPTPVLRLVARAQLEIDAEARSSMWEDLERRRPTEVDHLNGEIVRLAESAGIDAPVNRRIVELVHDVERKGEGSPKLSADDLYRTLAP
jgi:2-dehydropantoate 2-reductase